MGVADAVQQQRLEGTRLLPAPRARQQLPAPLRGAPTAAGTAGAPRGPGAQLAAGCEGSAGSAPCHRPAVPLSRRGGTHQGRAVGCTQPSPPCRQHRRGPRQCSPGSHGAETCYRHRSCGSRVPTVTRVRRRHTPGLGRRRSRSRKCCTGRDVGISIPPPGCATVSGCPCQCVLPMAPTSCDSPARPPAPAGAPGCCWQRAARSGIRQRAHTPRPAGAAPGDTGTLRGQRGAGLHPWVLQVVLSPRWVAGLCRGDAQSRVWVHPCATVQPELWGSERHGCDGGVGQRAVLGGGGCRQRRGSHTRLAGPLQTLDVGPEVGAGAGAAVGAGRGEDPAPLRARLPWRGAGVRVHRDTAPTSPPPRRTGTRGCWAGVTWADVGVAALGLGLGTAALPAARRVLGLALPQAVAPAAGVPAGPPGTPAAPEAGVCGTRASPVPWGHPCPVPVSTAPCSPPVPWQTWGSGQSRSCRSWAEQAALSPAQGSPVWGSRQVR